MASCIISKIADIEKLRVYPIGSKPVRVVKLTAVGNTVVAVDANGKVYSNQIRGNTAYLPTFGHNDHIGRLLDGLAKMGALTAEAVKAHKDRAREHQEKSSRRYSAEAMREAATALGIKLTAAQDRKLAEHGSNAGVTGLAPRKDSK